VWVPSGAAVSPDARSIAKQASTAPPLRVSRSAKPVAQQTSNLRHIGTKEDASGRPAWIDAPGAVMGRASEHAQAPPPPRLFGPPSGRAILSSALSTSIPEGDVDVERIIETLSEAQPVLELPRQLSATLRRGVQLLVDHGPGMVPFRADQEMFVTDLDDVLSDDRLEVLRFVGCPSRGVLAGPDDRWTDWRPPPPGTPVLAVTDAGLGGSPLDPAWASPDEWLEFAHHVRDEGSDLFALVPWQASRWPPALARAMTLLHWSERTTVGEVRHAVRRAYERR
jgi:hypothetical protein